MIKITIDTAERLAQQMRVKLRMGTSEPLNMKTVIRQLNIMTLYRPLSEGVWGLSLKSDDGKLFMLISSNATRGSQHFTIAHELYHLFYDDNPKPHFFDRDMMRNPAERYANMFASALLMPKEGLLNQIPESEYRDRTITIETALRLEQLYGVSHSTFVIRLQELKMISAQNADYLKSLTITNEAKLRGFDTSLYHKGNENLIIGDYGIKARQLFEQDLISEGHYLELLQKINYGEGKDHS